MKKIFFLLAFAAGMGLCLHAQQLVVLSSHKPAFSTSGGHFYPKFSPDGKFMLTTRANYSGIYLYDFTSDKMQQINAEPGAGYQAQISDDGNTILYNRIELINNRRHNSLHTFTRTEGTQKQLTQVSREPVTPRFAGNKPSWVQGKSMVRPQVTTAEMRPVITIEDRKMVIYQGTTRKVLDPNGDDASYIWPSFSPDGKNIVYTVAGRGTFVCTVDGKKVRSLGKLNAPAWLNNNWVVGMDDRDHGGRVVASELYVVAADGTKRQQISTPEALIAMYPAVSPDGSRIAFNTDNGEIYILQVTIR